MPMEILLLRLRRGGGFVSLQHLEARQPRSSFLPGGASSRAALGLDGTNPQAGPVLQTHGWTGTGWQTDQCGQPAGLGDRSEGPSSTPAGSPGTPEGKQLCGQTPLRNALPTGPPRTRLPRAVQGRRAVRWFLLVEHALLGRRVTSASSHEGTVRMRSTSRPAWAETLRPLGGVLCTDP